VDEQFLYDEQEKGNVQMNTIVREMNPTEEVELTDSQLSAVYGAYDDESQSQAVCQAGVVYQPHVVYQPKLVWEAKPVYNYQDSCDSTIIHKKVITVFEKDYCIKRDYQLC